MLARERGQKSESSWKNPKFSDHPADWFLFAKLNTFLLLVDSGVSGQDSGASQDEHNQQQQAQEISTESNTKVACYNYSCIFVDT